MAKEYNVAPKATRWIEEISDNDPLREEKKEAMEIAADLFYKAPVFEKILEATNGIQISNALKSGRNVGNDLKFCKVTKNGSSYVAYC